MKICNFQHKIYYNLACVGDTAQMHVRNRGFSGSANLMVSNFAQTTPVAIVTKTYQILTENCFNRSHDFAHMHKLIYGYYHSAVRYDAIHS